MNNTKVIIYLANDEEIVYDKVINPKLLEEVDFIPNEVTANEISFDILDENGYFDFMNDNNKLEFIKKNIEIKIYKLIKNQEYFLGKFYLKDYTVKGNLITIKAQDIISKISDEKIDLGFVVEVSVGTILDSIFGENNYEIASDLKAKTLTGFFGKAYKNEHLLKLMFFTNLLCVTSRKEIPLFRLGLYNYGLANLTINDAGRNVYEISKYIQDSNNITHLEKYNKLLYKLRSMNTKSEEEQIIFSDTLNSGTYDIDFDELFLVTNIDGATLNDVKSYTDIYSNKICSITKYNSANITVPNRQTITIKGKKINSIDNDEVCEVTTLTDEGIEKNLDISSIIFVLSGFYVKDNKLVYADTLYNNRFSELLLMLEIWNKEFTFDYDIADFDDVELLKVLDYIKILTDYTYEYRSPYKVYEDGKIWREIYSYQKTIEGNVGKLDIDLDTMIATITMRAKVGSKLISTRKEEWVD